MAQAHFLAIDQGTSSSRVILFDESGGIKSVFQKPLQLHYPHPGWVEQNPNDIWADTLWALKQIGQTQKDILPTIAGIGITNQRETTILWDRKTGQPVYNAIVWQDRRTADFCENLKKQGIENEVVAKTGLLLDPYFSATKIRWILDNVPGARERAKHGDICFGTVDSFLLWHMTNGKIHATDATNASRTMLYNIIGQQWDKNLLQIFDIPEKILPNVKDNISIFGQIDSEIIGCNLAINAMVGDQQGALVGQGCINPGMVKSTYGTGCFALMNSGSTFTPSRNRLLTTLAYRINGKSTYAIEGSIFNAGTAIQFLRDNLNLISQSSETEALAQSVPHTDGVYFVPAFTGLGAPYWDPSARGLISGLNRDTHKAHIIRAALEAQAYQTQDLIGAMEKDGGHAIKTIRADGGLVSNNFVCQFLADITQRPIEIPAVFESTAWGAACLAGIGAGVFENLESVAARWNRGRLYTPSISHTESKALYSGWQRAITRASG